MLAQRVCKSLIYSDLSTLPAFGIEKAAVVFWPGLFFCEFFKNNKKKKQKKRQVWRFR